MNGSLYFAAEENDTPLLKAYLCVARISKRRLRHMASTTEGNATSLARFRSRGAKSKKSRLSHKLVVIGMTADPIPQGLIAFHDGERSIAKADSNRIDILLDSLEPRTGMRWINPKQTIGAFCVFNGRLENSRQNGE